MKVTGALFFGASSIFDTVFDDLDAPPRGLILDIGEVPFLDASGAHTIEGLVRRCERRGVAVAISAAPRPLRVELLRHGVSPRRVLFTAASSEAREALAAILQAKSG